jgi:hypothetical protein
MRVSPKQLVVVVSVFCSSHFGAVHAQESGAGNASDPTAVINYVDFRLQTFDLLDSADRDRYALEGAFRLNPENKIAYEINYWDTDVTGESESGLESVKATYLNLQSKQLKGGLDYRLALGAEVIVDQGDTDEGIGSGTDQIGVILGAGWDFSERNSMITLLQYYHSVNEDDGVDQVRSSEPRLIWIHSIPGINGWLKIDDRLTIDHENDYQSSNTIEVQLGTMFTPSIGAYIDYLTNNAGVRSYDDGWGFGLRITF